MDPSQGACFPERVLEGWVEKWEELNGKKPLN